MENKRFNKNRGYKKLRVWSDAVSLYSLTSSVFRRPPYELRRIASADSIHRNIAEGYCRRSVKEYIQFPYYALGSLGESVSGYAACHAAQQLKDEQFESLDSLAYKVENELLKLIESLEKKKNEGDWVDHL